VETREGLELRADGGRIHGVAIRYGDIAERTPHGRRERFLAGAFAPLGAASVNIEHDRRAMPLAWTNGGGLVLHDGPDALRIDAELQGDAGKRAYDDVAAGKYRGLSVEFAALRDRVDVYRNLRTIPKYGAVFHGVALTERPVYANTTIEARHLELEERAGGFRLIGRMRHGSRIITSDRGRVRKVEYGREAWEYSVNSKLGQINELTLTLNRNITRQLASRRAGTLKVRNGKSALHFEADLPPRGESQLVDEFLASVEHKTTDWQIYPVIQIPPVERVPRPYIDIPENPNDPSGVLVRKFLDVGLRQISLVAKSGSPDTKLELK